MNKVNSSEFLRTYQVVKKNNPGLDYGNLLLQTLKAINEVLYLTIKGTSLDPTVPTQGSIYDVYDSFFDYIFGA